MANDNALTPKQRQVVSLISGGKTVNEAAKVMKINPQGVYGHIRRIKDAKLGHLLEPGAVASLEGGNGSASSNGSSEVGEAVERLVQEAIGLADGRVKEIEERRNELANAITNLKAEDDALAVEAARLTDERERLAATS